MNFLIKTQLNELAVSLALVEGFVVQEYHDFHKYAKKSSRDRKFWNMSVVAWSILKNDDDALKFQVK